MKLHLRVVLTNTQHVPTRNEIASIERSIGEHFFRDIPLEWAGWAVQNDAYKLSAQWLAEHDQLDAIVHRIETTELSGYKISVFLVNDEEMEEPQIV